MFIRCFRGLWWMLIVWISFMVFGCGQKGPLYLPPTNPPTTTPPTTTTTPPPTPPSSLSSE